MLRFEQCFAHRFDGFLFDDILFGCVLIPSDGLRVVNGEQKLESGDSALLEGDGAWHFTGHDGHGDHLILLVFQLNQSGDDLVLEDVGAVLKPATILTNTVSTKNKFNI